MNDFSRAKRERVWRYYSKVISLTLSALDDGPPSRIPSREYIEFLLSAIGFDNTEEWIRFHDEELIKANITALRVQDDAAFDRGLERIRQARNRLNEWQAIAGNPLIIEHRVVYEKDAQHSHSEYRLPIAGLLREIIQACPIGTHHKTLKVTINRCAAEYLNRFHGSAKTTKRKKEHSPESDANRAATFALAAFEKESQRHGLVDATALVYTKFKERLGANFTKIFGNLTFCAKCQQEIDLHPNVSSTNVTCDFPGSDSEKNDLQEIPRNTDFDDEEEGEWVN